MNKDALRVALWPGARTPASTKWRFRCVALALRRVWVSQHDDASISSAMRRLGLPQSGGCVVTVMQVPGLTSSEPGTRSREKDFEFPESEQQKASQQALGEHLESVE